MGSEVQKFQMERISPENPSVKYGIFATLFSTFIAGLVASIATSTDLVFGGKYCLLFVENYHSNSNGGGFIFDAYSGTCSSNIAMGWISVIAVLGIAGTHYWMMQKSIVPSKTILMALGGTCALFTLINLFCASISSAGLAQT